MDEYELLKHFPEKVGKAFDERPELICPITHELFVEPVFVDGYTFEKSAILTWFQKSQLNPITKGQIPHAQRQERNLRINFDKKSTVAAFKSKIMKKVNKYFEEYFGQMSMSEGEERERIVKLLEKLIERGYEMEPKNVGLLSNALKYYDTMMKVSPNRVRVFKRKRELYLKNYIESLVEKKSFEPALEVVRKEPDFDTNPKLIEQYIRILRLSGPENEDKMIEYQFKLVDLWISKKKFKNAQDILIDRRFKHSIRTLLLLKFTIYPNLKRAKSKVMPSHLTRELASLYFKDGRYEDALIEILSLPDEKPAERNLKVQELIEIKKQLQSIRPSTEETKKHISKCCLELSNLFMISSSSSLTPSRASLERSLKVLREGHEADPASLPLLKKLFDFTEMYMEKHLKEKLRSYEGIITQHSRDIDTLKRDNSKLRIENNRVITQNNDLRKMIENLKKEKSTTTTTTTTTTTKLPPRVSSSKAPQSSISQITSVKRTSGTSLSKTGKGVVIWSNYICDECRSQPIIGPRYESADEHDDYDLCEDCYLAGKGGLERTFKVFFTKEDKKGKDVKVDVGYDEDEKLKKLREMGFHTDQRKLKSLLRKHKGDLIPVVKEMLKLKKKR